MIPSLNCVDENRSFLDAEIIADGPPSLLRIFDQGLILGMEGRKAAMKRACLIHVSARLHPRCPEFY